jgi:hypothetical protein
MPRVLPSAYRKKKFRFFFLNFFGNGKFEFFKSLCRGFCRRRSVLRRGPGYADGDSAFAEGLTRRGAMPRAALGIAYAEGQSMLRRGFPALGI